MFLLSANERFGIQLNAVTFFFIRLLSSKKSSQLYKSRVSFMKEKSKGILQKEKDMSQLVGILFLPPKHPKGVRQRMQ